MKVGGLPPLQKLARFKLELKEAIKSEKYEKAAQLRDRIRDLEQKLHDTCRISKMGLY